MLFRKELKKALFSIPFLLLFAVTFLMYGTQTTDYLSEFKKLVPPEPGAASYGSVRSEEPDLVMPAALEELYAEFVENEFATYPIGFYRRVRLGEREQAQLAEILSQLTGLSKEELLSRVGGDAYRSNAMVYQENDDGTITVEQPPAPTGQSSVSLKEGLSYERFRELMAQTDSLLGGGSSFALSSLSGFGMRDKTYEEALAEYEAARDVDGFTGAHARLFSDYMTLFAAWMPAFLMVSECLRDRRAKMRDLVWARKASSLGVTLCRYFSVVLLSLLPILILAGIDTFRSVQLYAGQSVDALAYLKYALGWTLPTVMFSAAVGLFFTELTDTPVGLIMILAYWFVDLNRGMAQMSGGYEGLLLVPRHNSLLGAQTFARHFNTLAVNRLFYLALALLLVGASALILEAKRKGGGNGYDSFKARLFHRKNLPAA